MNLTMLLPSGVFLDKVAVRKVSADSAIGSFTLLPRHVDAVFSIETGILTYVDDQDREHFVAVNEGVLVKVGQDVRVSVREAVQSDDLSRLTRVVKERFQKAGEQEQKARKAMARLEAGFVRRFMEVTRGT